MTTSQKRTAYYDRVYNKANLSLNYFKKNERNFFQVKDPKGKNVGQAIKLNGETHKALYKRFPDKFPPVQGYMNLNNRLVKKEKVNLTRKYKADDWKQLGFKTVKEGREFIKSLRPYLGNFVNDEEKMREVLRKYGTNTKIVRRLLDENKNKIARQLRKYIDRVDITDRTSDRYSGFLRNLEFRTKSNFALRKNGVYDYFNNLYPMLFSQLKKYMTENPNSAYRFWLTTRVVFKNDLHPEKEKEYIDILSRVEKLFPVRDGKNFIELTVDEIGHHLRGMTREIIEKIETYITNGSGFVLDSITASFLNISHYSPKNGKKFFNTIPQSLLKKKSVYIPHNDDDLCFLYCCLYHKHSKEIGKDAGRISKLKPFIKKYNIDLSLFPVEIMKKSKMISVFEQFERIFECKIHLSTINICDRNPSPSILYCSQNTNYTDEMDLLLIQDPVQDMNHFSLIKDVGTFYNVSRHRAFLCRNCRTSYRTAESLKNHQSLCFEHETTHIVMPKEGSHHKFVSHSKQLSPPYVVFWDTETYMKNTKGDLSIEQPSGSCVKHVPSGAFAIVYSTFENKIVKRFLYRGEDCVKQFLEEVVEYIKQLRDDVFEHPKPLIKTQKVEDEFRKARQCYLCQGDFPTQKEWEQYHKEKKEFFKMVDTKTFVDEKARKTFVSKEKPESMKDVLKRRKVRDHCHFTGKFRGVACHECNLHLTKTFKIPVIAHNFKNYDSHLLVRAMGENIDCLNVIPNNTEKFMSASINITKPGYNENFKYKEEVVFIDSFLHLSSSLDTLSKNLTDEDRVFTRQFIKSLSTDENDFEKKDRIATSKGSYPYEYFDSLKKFNETGIPSVPHFVSSLDFHGRTYEQLTEDEKAKIIEKCEKAKHAYETFGFKNLWEYHDFYMQLDVYLLCDIWNRYRGNCLKNFQLDPSHYITIPSTGWDGLFKCTNEKVELMSSMKNYLLLEKGKIGGISMVGNKRYVKANHKMLRDYDPKKPNVFIINADVNGLYSWGMKQKLPYGPIHDIPVDEFNLTEALEDVDGDVGYFLEIDFPIPKELHDKFKDYPILPENIKVTDEMLSPYQHKVKDKLQILKHFNETQIDKLVPNLNDKKNYVIHIKHLQLVLGLCDGYVKPEDIKIHNVMRFKQKAWMKPYIDTCMQNREVANNAFDKDFWKLCSNAVYGKTMEDVRHHMNLKFYRDPDSAKHRLSDFRFSRFELFDETLGIYSTKQKITLDKPIQVGVAILNLAKWMMYDLWYNQLKKQYGDKIELLYTDTDSFIFSVQTEDFYSEVDPSIWDFSNYPKDHPLYSNKNKRVAGKIKDETAGIPITEFCGNRSKQYAIRLDDSHFHTTDTEWKKENSKLEKCVGKGIARSILKTSSLDDYKRAIFHDFKEENMTQKVRITNFKSHKHEVYTTETIKAFQSSFDDKRFILDNGIDCLPYGHYLIEEMKQGKRPWSVEN